uniref:Fatty acyl-CoA reductase n=1 Tax=Culicoides sonorensis TaxID=179676 RepID=A0A336L0D6_CULSO
MVASHEILTEMDTSQFMGTPMQQFYNKKSIFLTGGTGFLGKILMDKLLRTCDIESFYILIRNKKGKGMHSRIEEIFDDPLFDRLKREKPKFRSKIVGISGDCVLPGLGINAQDRDLLRREVNIVFHVAATVRFDEKLKLALGINVNGTKEVVQLCKEIKSLHAFVHVSTAYANCNRNKIDETFYKPKISGENAIKLAECLDEKLLDTLTPELIKGFPNTYTFTKNLAEDYVKNHAHGLPCAVFRPAIVIPTCREPVVGWIDNHFGPTGIIVGVGAGLLRVIYVDKTINAEIVPVDMCVNSLLASGWDVANTRYDHIPVYNFTTSPDNPITWEQYTDLGLIHGSKMPTLKAIWYYTVTLAGSWPSAMLMQFFYHLVPAFFMDIGLIISGKKPKMVKIYQKIHKFCDVISYFNTRRWYFTNSNVMALWKKLDPKDKQIFYFDMNDLDWNEFTRESIHGIRQYLMKDDPSTIPDAIKRMKNLKVLHYIVVYASNAFLLYLLYLILFKFYSIFFISRIHINFKVYVKTITHIQCTHIAGTGNLCPPALYFFSSQIPLACSRQHTRRHTFFN